MYIVSDDKEGLLPAEDHGVKQDQGYTHQDAVGPGIGGNLDD